MIQIFESTSLASTTHLLNPNSIQRDRTIRGYKEERRLRISINPSFVQLSKSVKLSEIRNMADFQSCERSSQVSFHRFLVIAYYIFHAVFVLTNKGATIKFTLPPYKFLSTLERVIPKNTFSNTLLIQILFFFLLMRI